MMNDFVQYLNEQRNTFFDEYQAFQQFMQRTLGN